MIMSRWSNGPGVGPGRAVERIQRIQRQLALKSFSVLAAAQPPLSCQGGELSSNGKPKLLQQR